jgi:hypothetical protein
MAALARNGPMNDSRNSARTHRGFAFIWSNPVRCGVHWRGVLTTHRLSSPDWFGIDVCQICESNAIPPENKARDRMVKPQCVCQLYAMSGSQACCTHCRHATPPRHNSASCSSEDSVSCTRHTSRVLRGGGRVWCEGSVIRGRCELYHTRRTRRVGGRALTESDRARLRYPPCRRT